MSYRWLKALVAGTGNEFMDAAKAALESLGFMVTKVEGTRTDLIAFDGEKAILACETKGVERSAKEEDLRQARQWVSEVDLALVAEDESVARDPHLKQCATALRDLGVAVGEDAAKRYTVRGLLLLATFRSVPFAERTVSDFPNDLLLNAKRSEVCVVTGHQLANIVLSCEKAPEKKAELRRRLFESGGALPMDDIPNAFRQLSE
jgi:hypothetical protein